MICICANIILYSTPYVANVAIMNGHMYMKTKRYRFVTCETCEILFVTNAPNCRFCPPCSKLRYNKTKLYQLRKKRKKQKNKLAYVKAVNRQYKYTHPNVPIDETHAKPDVYPTPFGVAVFTGTFTKNQVDNHIERLKQKHLKSKNK